MGTLASCITPTYNRRAFLPRAIQLFLEQDYPDRELIVVDDGNDPVADLIPSDPRIRYFRLPERLSVGAKRNFACKHAAGRFIVHWDDDDWYPANRISRQIQAMDESSADYSGSSQIYFVDEPKQAAWLYRYHGHPRDWVAGTTMVYRREMWERSPFPEVNVAEDTYFLLRSRAKGIDLKDPGLAIASVHPDNVCPRQTSGMFWTPQPWSTILQVKQTTPATVPGKSGAVAFIWAYNEADILRWTLGHLLEQGVSSYIFDHGSTDGSAEIAAEYPLAGFERVPRTGQPSLAQILQVVEQRAAESRFAWCMHHDADEIRRVPTGERVLDGLTRLAAQGFTAVNHDVVEFVPTRDGFDGSQNPELFFTHCRTDTIDQRCGQVRTWRNIGRVSLADSGGHRATAPWVRVAPERWIMKHYPLRSQAQGLRKVLNERNWVMQERSRSWHVQYSGITPEYNVVRSETELQPWVEPPKLAVVTLTRFVDLFTELAASLAGCSAAKVVVTSGGAHAEAAGWTSISGSEPFVFARNINAALAHPSCAGRDVLLVNDDVRFRSGSDPYLLQSIARSDPSIGIISPKILGGVGNRNQSSIVQTGRLYYEDSDRLCFVCVLIKAEALIRTGLLDERFSGYGGDDDDYCLRMRQSGFRLAVTDSVVVDHGRTSPIAASTSFLRVMTDADRVASMRSMLQLVEQKHGAAATQAWRSQVLP